MNIWDKYWQEITAGLLVTIFVVALFTVAITASSFGCANRWEGIYPSEYKFGAGCRVNVDGKWIPEYVLRVVK